MIDLLNKNPQIVLLGHSEFTRDIIKSLNRDYSISPILYDSRRMEGCGFFLQYYFFKQQLPDNEFYTLQSLLELPHEFEHNDNYILVPLSRFFDNFVQANIDQLESTYIVSCCSELVDALPSFKPKGIF